MRMFLRAVAFAVLAAAMPALSGCTNFDLDSLDVFHLNEKKKLPGERKELFPGGVPGVTQGIPPEYVKGNQPPPETAQALQAPATEQNKAAEEAEPEKKAAAVEPEPKPKPKRPAKPRTASQATQAPAQPQQQMAPWPQQDPQPAPQQAQSPWPATTQTAPAPWPSSPQPGTFSR
jgi:outer membrane biosynthesis protein TonB